MASFLVETYASRLGADGLDLIVSRAREAALTLSETSVRHVQSYVVPGDEMCFHVFESASAEEVARVCDLAGIEFERIVETIGAGRGPGAEGRETG